MPVTATTELPDEDQPVLGNGVEDEIAVDRESATTNYGSVRVEYRETSSSTWIDWGVVAYDRLDPIIAGLEDGEEYEVRLRTETEHVIGAWTEPVSIVTKFPGATQLAITGAGQTSVDLEFTDNADNETGVYLERRELFRDGWGPWDRLKDLGANAGTGTVTATDDTVLPATTYQYHVIPYTEHSSATSASVETTTDDDGVRSDRVTPEGWHVVVEADDGTTIQPTIVGEPTINRKLNAKPTCEIPVTQHERWSTDRWGGADMRVYRNGERQPIEELRRPRDGPGRVTLIGEGGVDLDERVTIDVIERDAHLVADDAIQQASGYVRNVDDPAGDPSADVLQESVDDESEWTNAVGSAADQPWTVRSDGSLEGLRTAEWFEAEGSEVTRYITEFTASDGDASGGESVRIDEFELNNTRSGFSATFETEHDIPFSEFGIAVRVHYTGSGDHHAYTAEVDGTEIGLAGAALNVTNSEQQLYLTTNSGLSGTLSAGEHTLQIRASEEATGVSDLGALWDGFAWFDARFDPDFTDSVVGDVLQGPDEYPEPQVETGDITTVRQVIGGRLDITSGMAAAELALSNDNGVTFPVSATDATSVEGQFSSGSSNLRARITLTGYDASPNTSPAGRTAPQSVDGYQLFADLDDTPLLVNRSYSGSAEDVLVDIADYADALWEATWDEATGSIAIEWTQPGQRTASVDPDVVDYSSETDYGSIHRKAVIKGETVPASTDSVTVPLDSWVALDHDWLSEVGETVTDDSGTEYERGIDYELRPNAGELQALSTGSISDGATLSVEYQRHVVGEYESPDYDGTYPVLEETLPAVTTQRNAEQAALTAVRIASEPITTASVTVSALPSGVDLVDAVALDVLPVDETLEQWSVDNSPQETTLQLGSRDPVEETLERLNTRLRAVSQKV